MQLITFLHYLQTKVIKCTNPYNLVILFGSASSSKDSPQAQKCLLGSKIEKKEITFLHYLQTKVIKCTNPYNLVILFGSASSSKDSPQAQKCLLGSKIEKKETVKKVLLLDNAIQAGTGLIHRWQNFSSLWT